MELERQVVSLALAQRLKALGVKQESISHWKRLADSERWGIHVSPLALEAPQTGYAAFTVAELGELLPPWSRSERFGRTDATDNKWRATHYDDRNTEARGPTEAEARGSLLAALLEHGGRT